MFPEFICSVTEKAEIVKRRRRIWLTVSTEKMKGHRSMNLDFQRIWSCLGRKTLFWVEKRTDCKENDASWIFVVENWPSFNDCLSFLESSCARKAILNWWTSVNFGFYVSKSSFESSPSFSFKTSYEFTLTTIHKNPHSISIALAYFSLTKPPRVAEPTTFAWRMSVKKHRQKSISSYKYINIALIRLLS